MKLELKNIPTKLGEFTAKLKRYSVLLFIVLVLGVYGYMVMRVNNLENAKPNEVSGTTKLTPVITPHIDQAVVQQLRELHDNSVNVKALFAQDRSDPFQE
jgi:hypothetical protein